MVSHGRGTHSSPPLAYTRVHTHTYTFLKYKILPQTQPINYFLAISFSCWILLTLTSLNLSKRLTFSIKANAFTLWPLGLCGSVDGLASDFGLASGPICVSLLQDPPTHFPCYLVTPVLPHASWPASQTAQRFLVHGEPCQLSEDSEV